jgi:RNA polymerase primary sigma factor
MGNEEHTFQDMLHDTNAADLDETLDQHLLRERIDLALRSLSARDREVLELRFGLKDGRTHSLDEVARLFGVTRERVRQLEARGLHMLREGGRRELLADFVERN